MKQDVSKLLSAALPHNSAELVTYVHEGDSLTTIFDNVFRIEGQGVYRYVFAVLRNEADAQDLTQDIFLKLWLNLEKVRNGKIRHWLYRVARNQVIDYLRKKKPVFLDCGENDEFNPMENLLIEDGFESDVCNQHLAWSVLSQLSEPERICLILKTGYGCKNKEIAKALGVSSRKVITTHEAATKHACFIWQQLKTRMSTTEQEVYPSEGG